MNGRDVVDLLQLLDRHRIEVYVDGGWGVDALLGEETRPHADLDIAVPQAFVPKLRELLESLGYKDIPRPDSWECNFVLGDDGGRKVDVHSYTLDERGNNVSGVEYHAEHFTGVGTIRGHAVKCVSPEWMVKFHSGYALDENDYRDVKALCERFDIPLPAEFLSLALAGPLSVAVATRHPRGL